MGFAACSMENEPVVENNKEVHIIKVVAGFDATRSGFGELEGDIYKQVWDGTETIAWGIATNDYRYENGTVSNETSGSSINFDITPGVYDPEGRGGKIMFCSPASSAIINNNTIVAQVPAVQTPLANSCDPLAHVLIAEATYDGFVKDLTTVAANFRHYSAYGRMTITSLPAFVEGDAVKDVVLNIGSYTYTLNPKNVVDNVYWFGCAHNDNVTAMTVTIRTNNGYSYTKALNLDGKNFAFETGKLTTFKVGMSSASVIAPEEDDEPELAARRFTHVEWWGGTDQNSFKFSNDEGDYVIVRLSNKDYETVGDATDPNAIRYGDYHWAESGSPSTGYFRIIEAHIEDAYYSDGNYINVDNDPTVSVKITEDGKYIIDFVFTIGYSELGYELDYEYSYAEVEDELEPFPLAAPTNVKAHAEGREVTITWDPVDGAGSYQVEFNDGASLHVDSGCACTYTFNEYVVLPQPTHANVRALSADTYKYSDSEQTTVEFVLGAQTLDTPGGFNYDATSSSVTLKWDAVEKAEGYTVAIEGGETKTVNNPEATFEGLTAGTEYTITVIAKGDGDLYYDSDAATTIVTTDTESSGGGEADLSGCEVEVSEFSSYGQPVLVSTTIGGKTITFRQRLFNNTREYTVTEETDATEDLYGIWSVEIDGVPATTASGTVNITVTQISFFQRDFKYSFNMVVDGVTYTGDSSSVTIK